MLRVGRREGARDMSISLMWLSAGILFVILEVATPGFVICFFGLAAITLSPLVKFFPLLNFGEQAAIFAVLSILYILSLRPWLRKIVVRGGLVTVDPAHESVGKTAKVVVAIDSAEEGRVELFGTRWKAVADVPLAAGEAVRVVGQDNLTLRVEKI